MLVTPSLPMLPPPSASLLPSLSPSDTSHTLHPHQHPHPHNHPHHHRRPKPSAHPRSTLSLLSAEERSLSSRKLAIAMYGYSWLKPAGCSKTMLGRHEEELERVEVERQLREVEMMEREAVEGEEMERREELRRQAEMEAEGGILVEGERDLDDDVPDADEEASELERQGDLEDGMEGDLDDEIPDADEGAGSEDGDEASPAQPGWRYDTNREAGSDTDPVISRRPGFVPQRRPPAPGSDYGGVDERDAADMVDQMLSEDAMVGEMDFDHDQEDDIPVAVDVNSRDLDDDVPDADEGGWEHTDSELELEDSEMDISILPTTTQGHLMPGNRRSSGVPRSVGSRRSSGRVISGNAAANLQATRNAQGRLQNMQTPQFSSDAIMGAGSNVTANVQSAAADGTQRNWLNGASARRNLFGVGRGQPGNNTASGRFFTPSPAQGAAAENDMRTGEEMQTPRRSGRFVGRRRGVRENRDSVD